MPLPDDPNAMHRDVEWMVAADVSILEFLDSARTARGEASVQTPNTIALNTGYSNRHCSARCQELAARGLVEKTGTGRYRLTDFGEAAIRDEITIDEIRARSEKS